MPVDFMSSTRWMSLKVRLDYRWKTTTFLTRHLFSTHLALRQPCASLRCCFITSNRYFTGKNCPPGGIYIYQCITSNLNQRQDSTKAGTPIGLQNWMSSANFINLESKNRYKIDRNQFFMLRKTFKRNFCMRSYIFIVFYIKKYIYLQCKSGILRTSINMIYF